VVLTYAHATLLDGSLPDELADVAAATGTGLINAAAVALGLLTSGGSHMNKDHPASTAQRAAAAAMAAVCRDRGVDLAFVANQYSIQRSGCATTAIGTARSQHLRSAVTAAETPIDESLLADLLALRPPPDEWQWHSGLPENN